MPAQPSSSRPRIRKPGVFCNLPVAAKIGVTVATGAVAAAVLGGVALDRMGGLDSAGTWQRDSSVAVQQLEDARSAFLTTRLDAYAILFAAPDARAAAVAKLQDDDAAVDAALGRYTTLPVADRTGSTLPGLIANYRTLRGQGLITAAQAGDVAAFTAALPSVKDAGTRTLEAFAAAVASQETAADKAQAAAHSSYTSGRTVLVVVLAVGLLLSIAIGAHLSQGITRPLARVRHALRALSEGDLTQHAEITQRDEVGQAARDLDVALTSLQQLIGSITHSADAVGASAEELSANSAEISVSAQQTSTQSGIASTTADEVSRNVATIAAGAEQMGASIREIASNATSASQVAQRAVEAAAQTSATVAKLGDSSAEIGNVVKTITSIAEQTNLLALNATIEAARAGEAGKGFAVVANEVKELAQETARATEDIARRVQAIQADTGAAVGAIEEISQIVAQISDRQTTIASAVEEQTATTGEMSRSVTEAAAGAEQIAGTITTVSDAAESTNQALGHSRTAVDELSRMAAELRASAGRFTV